MIAHVRLRIFTGRPNPEWPLADVDARKLRARMLSLPVIDVDQRSRKPRLGYRGFTITFVSGEARPHQFDVHDEWVRDYQFEAVRADRDRTLEQSVYSLAPQSVLEELDQMSFAALIQQGNEVPIAGLKPPDAAKIGCVNGPSPPASKAWVVHRDHNNCYNYANDVINLNDFAAPAMPGSLNSMPAATTDAKVKAALRAAIKKDGLTLCRGDKVPARCPAKNKHYAAIILRHHPASQVVRDFHCLRLDTDGTWSHKDALGVPRNTDDAGKAASVGDVITNLTKAKFDGTPVLVGVYRAKKDNKKIK